MDTKWTWSYLFIDLVWYLLLKTMLGWFKDMFYRFFAERKENVCTESSTNDSRVKIITLDESGDFVKTRIVLRKSFKAPRNASNVASGTTVPVRRTIGIQTDAEVGNLSEERHSTPVRRSTRITEPKRNTKWYSAENIITQEEPEEAEEVPPLILTRRRRNRE